MAYRLNDSILTNLSDLVVHYTKYTLDTDEYEHFFAKALSFLQNSSPTYASKEDINNKIEGLYEKYGFHGYLKRGEELRSLSAKFLGMDGENLGHEELQTRLNIMKFVLAMSTGPTSRLSLQTDNVSTKINLKEDDTNWGEYLMEGIERWNPPTDNDSSEYSDEDEEDLIDLNFDSDYINSEFNAKTSGTSIKCSSDDMNLDHFFEKYEESGDKNSFKSIKATYEPLIQHGWFNSNNISQHHPESLHKEARTALQWELFWENATGGLLKMPDYNIISEYKVMREIIFELYFCHENATFNYDGNSVGVKDNITIASSRPHIFQNFLNRQFIPYINTLHSIEKYCKDVMLHPKAPDTYRSFCSAVIEIYLKTIAEIGAIEKIIQKQEETYTLIRLSVEFSNVFQKITVLKNIINQVPDFLENKIEDCSIRLINILLKKLYNCTTKLEQDLVIFLLLESLLKYMNIIDSWLGQDDFQDSCDEYPRTGLLNLPQQNGWLFSILTSEVEKLGKNVHLLRRFRKLGKLKPNQSPGYITLHKEFVDNVIKDIATYSGGVENRATEETPVAVNYPDIFNAEVFDFSSNANQSGNMLDMSDRFLLAAFREFFVDRKVRTKDSLFERISGITKGFVCTYGLIENALLEALRSRYGESGNIVRDTLRNEYRILDHIEMIKHLYLFKDGIIFEFFLKLSKKINNFKRVFNPINLTLMLQDILMDLHPDFFVNVSVNVKELEDTGSDNETLTILSKINVNYKMDWPVTLFITEAQMKLYRDIFTLILQIKWSVYTLSNLQIKDNKVRDLKASNKKHFVILKRRLQILRFSLLNTMSYIQHFIFGSVFFKSSIQLETQWSEARNGEEFRQAHEHFITEMHSSCAKLNNFNSIVKDGNVGFYELLVTVNKLRLMESNLRHVKNEELVECENSARLAHKTITNIIDDLQYSQMS